jgi:hypothetical protein
MLAQEIMRRKKKKHPGIMSLKLTIHTSPAILERGWQMTDKIWRQQDWIILAFLTVLSASIRFYGLSEKPFWLGEIQQFAYAYKGSFLDNWLYAAGDFVGFSYQKFLFATGLSPHPLVIRLPAAIAGTLLQPLLYFLLRPVFGRQISFFTALLAAISLPLIAVSQTGRLYCLVVFWLTWSTLLVVSGKDRLRDIVILDILALLGHPYAVVWIAVRVVGTALSRRQWPWNLKQTLIYVGIILLPLTLQVWQIAQAHALFREVHHHFLLMERVPSIGLAMRFLRNLTSGEMAGLACAGGLSLIGIYNLSVRHPESLTFLALPGIIGPLAITSAIWLWKARFSYEHILVAAVPLYLSIAVGLSALTASFGNRFSARVLALSPGILLVALMLYFDGRYLERPTRLELGADIASGCQFLGRAVRPGDVIVTEYDKYFTTFAWYCGSTLPPDSVIAVPQIPLSRNVIQFNHLGATQGEPLVHVDQVVHLGSLVDRPVARVFILLPSFEVADDDYGELLLRGASALPYGESKGPSDELLHGWNQQKFHLLNVVWKDLPTGEFTADMDSGIRTILDSKRPMF